MLKEKKKLYSFRARSPDHKNSYKQVSKLHDNAISKWHDEIENNIWTDANQAKFYGYVNNKLKSKSFAPSLKDEEGSVADSDQDKANLLNATFHKVFKNNDGTDLISDCILSPQQCLHDFYISEDVSSAMHNIPHKLSRTPNGIPAYFWKRASAPFFHVIVFLFNLSLSQGVIHFQWKTAVVVPVFQKGSCDIPSNYRPISLICVMSSFLKYYRQ